MIQFNLIPDIKNQYLKTQRTKRLVIMTSISISLVFVFIFVLLFSVVQFAQKSHIKNLQKDIDTYLSNLKKDENLEKVLTIQNQLGSLTGLHDSKPVATRLYDYLVQVTPKDASISAVDIDFKQNTLKIAGTAKSIEVVNKFVDTLKFTDYELTTNETPAQKTVKKAYSSVVLDSFSSTTDDAGGVNYVISFKFDPIIFDINKDANNKPQAIQLKVPQNFTTTRSFTEKPNENFFKPAPSTENQPNNNEVR